MVRITDNLISSRVLYNLQNTMLRLSDLQDKLSTGRKINNSSDSPIDYSISLARRYSITQGRSFQRNIQSVRTNLETTETTMGSLTEVLQNLRTLNVQGINGVDKNARQALASQVNELYQHVLDLANTSYNGRYIFGGTSSKNKAFVGENGVIKYSGDDFSQQILIGKDNKITSNLNGFETFLHTPDQITSAIKIKDINAPLADQLHLANANFPNLPVLPSNLLGTTVDPSPNPTNSPTPLPNNYATFYVYDKEIKVDLSVDSLADVKNRINANVKDVIASITTDNQLVITSRRSDELSLRDGERNIGFEPDKPQQANLLSALGMHRIVYSDRSLNKGFPSSDPLVNGTLLPTPPRGTVQMKDDSFLFVGANTGPANNTAVPFGDNMAITDIDSKGNEKLDAGNNPVFVNNLQAVRITIDDTVVDLDLRSLTNGIDFNGTPGDFDDVPGSSLGDLYELINNHPDLKGKVTAYTNKDGYGIELSAVQSTNVFKVENLREVFGRDITTRVAINPLGVQTVTRTSALTRDTKLDDLPGALIEPNPASVNPPPGSLGIRRADPLPAGIPPSMNKGLIVVKNGDKSEAVDLRDAVTIGDVLDRINNSKTGVKAAINEWGTGLEIESIVPGDGELKVIDMASGTTAQDLGFVGTPPPARIQSDPALGLTPADAIGAGALAGVGAGTFEIEVRDGSGATIDKYSIPIAAGETIADIVKSIDEADGKGGPGGGLISANFDTVNNVLNVVSNYNGNTILIDPAKDTTAGSFTSVVGLNKYTAMSEANALTYGPAVSDQNTASILGVAQSGKINEIEEKNIFRTLKNLESGLRNDNTELLKQTLDDMDIDLDAILNGRTKLGARLNRLDSEESRLKETEDFSRQELSFVEDADFTQTVTDLSLTQNAFNAALAAAGKIVQQSLLNFLS